MLLTFVWQRAVLDGYGWFLKDQTSRISSVNKFLRKVPEYQVFLQDHAPHDKGLFHEIDIFFEGLNILCVWADGFHGLFT
jgi:hypothetical protein